ncbi:MAG: recombinase family protein [Pseudomonadota bacterium]
MGGTLPLGYDPPKDPLKARVLQINPTEAKTVRRLFDLYLTAGSLGATRIAAAEQGLSPRKSDHAAEEAPGAPIAPFSNGQLHYLLTNPVYRGLIRHKALVHPGQHEAIIDDVLWSAVQTKLQETAARKRQRSVATDVATEAASTSIAPQNSVEPSAPLMAKLFDETGERLTPSHTNRHNRRFRYYISRRLITKGADPTGWRLPAPHLEAVVLEALRGHLRTRAEQHDVLLRPEANTASLLADALIRLSAETPAQDLWPLIAEVHIAAGSIVLHVSRDVLAQTLGLQPDALNPDVMSVQHAFQRRRRGAETRLVTGTPAPQPDLVLEQNLARAHRWAKRLRRGETLSSIAASEACSDSFVRSRLKLAFLAPNLQRAILDGTAPPHLTTNLIVHTPLSHDWTEQMTALGL